MGFVDKLDNKAKHLKSRREEVGQVDQMRKTIEEENETVKEQVQLIGQYFWNLYVAGKYKPGEADKDFFTTIENSVLNIKLMSQQIEDRKISGIKEREVIDEDTKIHVAEKEKLAEEKRKQKEAENEVKRQQREAAAEEKRRQKAAAAEERRKQKEAAAEEKKRQAEIRSSEDSGRTN